MNGGIWPVRLAESDPESVYVESRDFFSRGYVSCLHWFLFRVGYGGGPIRGKTNPCI